MKYKKTLIGILSTVTLAGSQLYAVEILKSTDITVSETWTANNIYVITKPVVIKSGVTLTIEPGTLVLGVGDNKATSSKTDDEYGSLVVARGAQLIAEGTAAKPIIFDAYASEYGFDDNGRNTGPTGPRTLPIATRGFPALQNTNSNGTGTAENPNFGATPASAGSPLKSGGLWGGVILLGRAPINFYNNDGTQNFEKIIEGFPVADVADLKYGAVDAASWKADDNSGVLRYLSLRFGGYEFSTGSEINGLTLGGVGRGTTIENIEVVSNNDDGFEFFGGTVNTKYLVSAFNKDDSFDIDEGHQGKHQFWFAIQNNTTTATFGDNGLELDGGFAPAISSVDQTNNLAPFTTPDIYNMTVIGKGISETTSAGLRLRDNFKGKLHNSLITDFGLSLRGDSTLDAAALPVLNNTVFGDILAANPTSNGTYRVSTSSSTTNSNNIASTPALTNTVPTATAILAGISRTANGLLDPRPLTGSVAFTHTRTAVVDTALAEDISTVNYNGAFGTGLWIKKWTYLDEKGFLPADTQLPVASRSTVTVVNDLTVSATWTANNIYVITKPVVIKSGVTLTIEPGTLVLGVGDNKATSSKTDDEYGSLVVARGAQLIAEGTAAKPIIFDAYASEYGFDDNGRNTGPTGPRTLPIATRGFPALQNTNSNGTGTAENPNFGATPASAGSPLKSGGLWGGVILLGRAPINFYNNDGTQNFEKIIEGFPVADVADLKYGAVDAASWKADDNSGVLRYLSLRFGGYEFSTGSEINGLTLGGVGRGTTIENIEVVSNNDDGFEFFGGTVNTKYLVSAFNKDDSFDIDEGHQGKHQFWFAIQNNTTTATFGDNGLELDGGFAPAISSVDQTNNLAPFTTPDIYNMTVIGKGISETTSAGLRLRDNFKGKLHNSLITDFGLSLRGDSTLDAAALPVLNNTVFGDILAANPTSNGTYRVSTSSSTTNSNNIASTPALTNTVPSSGPLLTSISRLANGALDPRPLARSVAYTHTRTAVVDTALAEDISTVNYNGAFGLAQWTDSWTFLAEDGYTPSSVPSNDTDGDGIVDTLEAANTALGFNAAVNDATTVLGTLKTTAQFNANYTAGQTSVTSSPNDFSLYNAADILDLRTTAGITVQKVGNTATLTVPVQKSTGLNTWEAAGNMTLGVDVSASPTKEFYRLEVQDAN